MKLATYMSLLDLTLKCGACGTKLHFYGSSKDGKQPTLNVLPCSHCLEEMQKRIKENFYKKPLD